MAGTTYSRTSGKGISRNTFAAVRARYGDVDLLSPDERTVFDEAPVDVRARYIREHMRQKLPAELEFALAELDTADIPDYPGATSDDPHHGPGTLPSGVDPRDVAHALGMIDSTTSADEVIRATGLIERQLGNFTGRVDLVDLLPGMELYRTVGLLIPRDLAELDAGVVTNVVPGPYWEGRCPDTYASIAEWRAATAVLWEWNGDFGYVHLRLAKPIKVLAGTVRAQKIPRAGERWLPGGGQQFWVPRGVLTPDHFQGLNGRSLNELIKPTRFGSRPTP